MSTLARNPRAIYKVADRGRGEGTLSASRSRERGSEGNDESVWGFKWRRVSSMENHR